MKGSDKGKPMVAAPGELYSTAQGAPVASTELIYDYLKEKSQETINTEVLLKLNELEANQGGNDGLDELQILTKIDASLQSLNTGNSGTLGTAVAALASAVGDNTSGRSHEARIAALESTSPTDYSGRLNTIETNISNLGTGLNDANTSIQTEETRAKGEESRIEGLISSLLDYVDEQNNILNELLHVLKQSAVAEFDGIVDTATIRNVSTTEPVTKVMYVTSSKIFAASTQTTVFLTPVLYSNWPNRDLYMNDLLIPYTNKIYVYNGVSYIWDGDSLNPVGGEIISPEEDEETTQAIPKTSFNNINNATNYSYYAVTDLSNGVEYKLGNLAVSSYPNTIILTLNTPKNLQNGEYELESVHTYTRSKKGNDSWSEWIEEESVEIPETLQTFNSLYLNSDGSIKAQGVKSTPIDSSLLSVELRNLVNQINDLHEIKNRLNILENYTSSIDTKVNKALEQNSYEEVDLENNNIASFQLYAGTLSTANNTLTFKYTVQFVNEAVPYTIDFSFLEGGDYLTLSNHDTNNKQVVYTISKNTPKSSTYELKAQLIENNNDAPSAFSYCSGAFTYTDHDAMYNANWIPVLYVNSLTLNPVIQDTSFYIDADITNTDAEINIKNYSWSIKDANEDPISESIIKISSGAKSSRCYFDIGENVTTQQSAVITCQLIDEQDVIKSTTKTVSFVYKTSSEPSYFLKINSVYGTNMSNGIILDKHFSLNYTAYHFNTQSEYYGMSVWTIVKGPVMFDPLVSGDSFQLTDDAKGGDEIIIQVAPSKSSLNTDRITLYVVGGYNVPLTEFEIQPRYQEFDGNYLQMSVKTSPNIDNLKACSWEIVGRSKFATINSSGLITISPRAVERTNITVKATSLIDSTKFSLVTIGIKYTDPSTFVGNNRLSYISVCYNYGGNYIDFHAQGMYQNPNTGENIGLKHLEDTDVEWDFVENAVSDSLLQAACATSTNPNVYLMIAMTQVPIELVMSSQVSVTDQNLEVYQIGETVWYDYDAISQMNIPIGQNSISLGDYLGNTGGTSYTEHPILPENTIDFRDLALQTIPSDNENLQGPRKGPRVANLVSFDEDIPYRVYLPLDNSYHDFVIRCSYTENGVERTKAQAFHLFAFESYPFPPETGRLNVVSLSNVLTFDDSYPLQVDLKNYLEYDRNVLDDGAPNLVFASNEISSLKWNGILTLNNNIENALVTVYQPYRGEDFSNDPQQSLYAQLKPITVNINRGSTSLETNFTINCLEKYIGNIEGAPLDGVSLSSKDSSNNVLSGVTYDVVDGMRYCSVASNGQEIRIFGTGEVTVKGTLGNKVSYVSFDVELNPTAIPTTGYDQDNENY